MAVVKQRIRGALEIHVVKSSLLVMATFLFLQITPREHTSKLSLCSILEFVRLYIRTKSTIREAAKLTQTSTSTLVEWWVNCRMLCTGLLEAEPKFVGTRDNPI